MDRNDEIINAVKDGDLELVEELIEKGVDPSTENEAGISLIVIAAKNKDYEMVDLLKDYIDSEEYAAALDYDEAINDLLFMYGAIRDVEDYYDYRFSGDYENIYVLEDGLVKEVIDKALLREGIEPLTFSYYSGQDITDSLGEVFEVFGIISISDGDIKYSCEKSLGVFPLVSILAELGYNVQYEGTSGGLEGTPGVYYLE